MNEVLTVGSLFSGIGGIELGLENTGHFKTIWQSEIDPYASKVLEKNWPGIPNHGDITKIDWNDIEVTDIVCGGFPCQDISIAGKGAGIDGERSGLWKEMYRCICEVRPRYILVENVPVLTRRGLGNVLGDLAESGYNAEWNVVSASSVGARHRRGRIFIIGWNPNSINDGQVRRIPGRTHPESGRTGELADTNGINVETCIQEERPDAQRIPGGSNGSRSELADTTSIGLLCGGNEIDPTQTRKQTFCSINSCSSAIPDTQGFGLEKRGPSRLSIFNNEEAKRLLVSHRERNGSGIWSIDPADIPDPEGFGTGGRDVRGIRQRQDVNGPSGQQDDHGRGTEINAKRVWWEIESHVGRVANGVPSRVDRLRCLGNAVVPQVAELLGMLIYNFHLKLKEDHNDVVPNL